MTTGAESERAASFSPRVRRPRAARAARQARAGRPVQSGDVRVGFGERRSVVSVLGTRARVERAPGRWFGGSSTLSTQCGWQCVAGRRPAGFDGTLLFERRTAGKSTIVRAGHFRELNIEGLVEDTRRGPADRESRARRGHLRDCCQRRPSQPALCGRPGRHAPGDLWTNARDRGQHAPDGDLMKVVHVLETSVPELVGYTIRGPLHRQASAPAGPRSDRGDLSVLSRGHGLRVDGNRGDPLLPQQPYSSPGQDTRAGCRPSGPRFNMLRRLSVSSSEKVARAGARGRHSRPLLLHERAWRRAMRPSGSAFRSSTSCERFGASARSSRKAGRELAALPDGLAARARGDAEREARRADRARDSGRHHRRGIDPAEDRHRPQRRGHRRCSNPRPPDQELIKSLGLEGCFIVGFIGSLGGLEGISTLNRGVQGSPPPGTAGAPGHRRRRAALSFSGASRSAAGLERVVQLTGVIPHDQISPLLLDHGCPGVPADRRANQPDRDPAEAARGDVHGQGVLGERRRRAEGADGGRCRRGAFCRRRHRGSDREGSAPRLGRRAEAAAVGAGSRVRPSESGNGPRCVPKLRRYLWCAGA